MKTTKRRRRVHRRLLPEMGHHQPAQVHCLVFFSLPYEAPNSAPPLALHLQSASNGGASQCHAHLHSVGPCSITKLSWCIGEYVSPTQGATPKRGSPHPQLKGPRQSVGFRIPNSRGHAKAWERKTRRGKKERMAFAPERIWRCTWAGVLLRMQDLHFATNNTCIAARLANLPLESTSQQTAFV